MTNDERNLADVERSREAGAKDGGPDGRGLLIERVWKAAIAGGLFCLLFREELLRLIERWKSPQEMHGFLIPAFSLYFVYQERERLGGTVGRSSVLGLLIMAASLCGYLFFFFTGFSYPREMMMLGMLGGVVLYLGGWKIVRLVWLPVVFLIFAIPLPSRTYFQISQPLREMSSTVAAMILSLLPDIHAEASGVLIFGARQGRTFALDVAEACSGMRLLTAFVALGVAMAYLEERPLVHRILLLASTAPIAIFCNMVRVILTGLIHVYIGEEYATGTLHTLLGMSMLILAFGLYGLLAWLMSRLYVEEDEGEVLVVRRPGAEGSTGDRRHDE